MSHERLDDVVQLTAAKAFVGATVESLARWFPQAALLRAKIASGWGVREPRQQARALGKLAELALLAYNERLEAAPLEVAEHSLVRDVRRALLGLVDDLRKMQRPTPADR